MPQRTTTSRPRPRRDLMSQAEVADLLGVTTRTVRKYTAAGRLTAYRVGDRILRYDAAEVEQILRRVPTGGDHGTAA